MRFKPARCLFLSIFRLRASEHALSLSPCARALSALHGTFFFLSLALPLFSFSPHFLQMTHFNGTMRALATAFSTPTTQPTSRQGVATAAREGSPPHKEAPGTGRPWPRFAPADTGGLMRGRGVATSGPNASGAACFSTRTSAAAADFTICATCFGPLTHVS